MYNWIKDKSWRLLWYSVILTLQDQDESEWKMGDSHLMTISAVRLGIPQFMSPTLWNSSASAHTILLSLLFHIKRIPLPVLEYTPQDLALPDKAPDEYDNIHYTSENAHLFHLKKKKFSPTSPAAQHPVPASSLSSLHIVSSLSDHPSVNFNSAPTSSEFD